MARAAAQHSRGGMGIGVGPCSLPAAQDTDKQGSLLPSGCSKLGGGYQSVKVAVRGHAMSRRESFVPGVPHWHAALLSQKALSVLTRL